MTSGGDPPDIGDVGTNLVKNLPTVDDLKGPLLAAVGAADLALHRVNEMVAALRDRAGEARTGAEARLDETRAYVTELQVGLPIQFSELRERLGPEDLRVVVESYAEAAQTRYTSLVERGEAALERFRVTGYSVQAVELTEEALGSVVSQTRAVGKRAAKLVGVELPKKVVKADPVKKAPAKKAPVKKAPVKRAPAEKTATTKAAAKKRRGKPDSV